MRFVYDNNFRMPPRHKDAKVHEDFSRKDAKAQRFG
jgi:hypothetical protein